MLWLIGIPFAAALIAPLILRLLGNRSAPLTALAPGAVALLIVQRLPLDPDGAFAAAWDWVPALGISFAFRMDGLSATLALLISGIGTLILLYASGYMRDDPRLARLISLLLFFMTAMLGVVLSDDIFTLFVFWELTSVASFMLIGFKHEAEKARESARQALLVTGAGGLSLLAGLVMLAFAGTQAGLAPEEATRISILSQTDLGSQALFIPALIFIALGAFAKSAQMPLHFWLPNAMTAPTPVSAYLHSATMVKAGVFLLARLNPVFEESAVWRVLLTTFGAITMLVAAGMALGQADLKRILAYTTVSVLGTLTMLIGVGTDLAIKAAVVYLVAHACYKAALFMVAGCIEYATGTRDVRQLGALFKLMPITATAGLLAALSMAGAPPMIGFVGKELLLKATLNLETIGVLLIIVASIANMFLIAMALVVTGWPFLGRATEQITEVRPVPVLMWLGPLILAIAGIFVGIFPAGFEHALGSAMASSISGHELIMKLKLWHGMNPVALTALSISIVTLAAGFFLFLRWRKWLLHFSSTTSLMSRYGPTGMYDRGYTGMLSYAGKITRLVQSDQLRNYVAVILISVVVACAYPLLRTLPQTSGLPLDASWYELLLLLFVVVGAILAANADSRMSAVILLGVSGLVIATLFALFSAPDLAITQIMVEALTVILLVLVFHRLPQLKTFRSVSARLRDMFLALAAGGTLAALLFATTAVELPASVSDQISALSKPDANGRNIVNVILVDFRALDTLGEITVVAAAGFGVYALVHARVKRSHTVPTIKDAQA